MKNASDLTINTKQIMGREEIKRAIGYRAADLVESGMHVGLGTGSTAFYLIERLIQRCHEGLKIKAAASSEKSLKQAKAGGIPLLDLNVISSLDLTIDGADEVDAQRRMIKGAGGALVREKILAAMSNEMVVIIEASKQVPLLGTKPLPVEIIPFGLSATLRHIHDKGYRGSLRRLPDQSPYMTDNGNYLFDITFDSPRKTPEEDHDHLLSIPGVVDTGFFFHLAGRLVVGTKADDIQIYPALTQ